MNFKLTIGRKIGLGFGFLILLIIVVFGATFFAVNKGIDTFKESSATSEILIETITPSKEKVFNLRLAVKESKQLAIEWVTVQSRSDSPNKLQLKGVMRKFPQKIKEIKLLALQWEDEDKEKLNHISKLIDTLFLSYEEVITYLPDLASYDDQFSTFYTRPLIITGGPIPVYATLIDDKLADFQEHFEKEEETLLALTNKSTEETSKTFKGLDIFWVLGALLILFSVLIAVFTTKSIVTPVKYLKKVLLALGKGIIPSHSAKVSNDEIGEMSDALNHLVSGLKKTTSFARDVGQSKFDSPYQPLSEDDELGYALLSMRNELEEKEKDLERKVVERTEEVVKQKEKVQELYKDVRDSIVYAKRLQNTILPTEEKVKSVCPESFVYYEPKDIVSGDFYWFEKYKNKSLFAVVDCTGHGVPGAFMSLLGSNGLNAAITQGKLSKPSSILDFLNQSIFEVLNKGDASNEVRDGMDVAICSIDYTTLVLEYSGANNPLYIVRDQEFLITKSDKMAIGAFTPGEANYTNHKIQLEKGDHVYIFSDGYPDQFGGPRGRKLMYNRFREYLLSITNKPIHLQGETLKSKLDVWQGKMDQIDDILVIGIKI